MKIRWHHCENCRFRAYSQRKPNSIIARLWRWHTRWCPAWKAYEQARGTGSQDKPQG